MDTTIIVPFCRSEWGCGYEVSWVLLSDFSTSTQWLTKPSSVKSLGLIVLIPAASC